LANSRKAYIMDFKLELTLIWNSWGEWVIRDENGDEFGELCDGTAPTRTVTLQISGPMPQQATAEIKVPDKPEDKIEVKTT
jgi:hypothetical protein